MFNLIKMDFYRLFRSKALRIGVIAAAAIAFLGMLLNLGVLELIKFAISDDPSSAENMGILFPIVSWLNGVDFADVVFTGTNNLALFVSCMVVASFIGAEQSCGYIKNVAGQLPNRGMTVVSKFVVTCFVQLIILLIYTAVSCLCAPMFFSSYIKAYSIGIMIEGLLIRFLLFCAINAIVLFICTLTKSHAVSMVVGAILGIGVTSLVYLAANALLSMAKITVDIAKIMPDGINGLINVSDLGTIAVRAIIVSVIFIAGFLIGAVLLFRKKDVK
jgi:ABC-type transport system involved in multi-copper enzyme maturation permease subunit